MHIYVYMNLVALCLYWVCAIISAPDKQGIIGVQLSEFLR